MNDQLMRFGWVVPASGTAARTAELKEVGAELEQEAVAYAPPPEEEAPPSFEPLTMIVGAMALVSLVKQVWSFVEDTRHRGLIVDTRADAITIREHPSLDRGKILVISADKREVLDATDRPDLAALLSAVK